MISTLTIHWSIRVLYAYMAVSYLLGIPVMMFLNSLSESAKATKHYLVLFLVWLFSPIVILGMIGIAFRRFYQNYKNRDNMDYYDDNTEEDI